MKRILFLLVLLCLEKTLHAQAPRTPYVYSIKADSVKITNSCDTAELIIENHTQTVPGFLFNKGRGRTEFRRISQFDDTSVVIGGDTIHLGRGYKNFANANLKFTGNRLHDGAAQTITLNNFNGIYLNSRTSDSMYVHELALDTLWGIKFRTFSDWGDGTIINSSLMINDVGLNYNFDQGVKKNILNFQAGKFKLGTYLNTQSYVTFETANNHETGQNDLLITDKGADISIRNFKSAESGRYCEVFMGNGDSITLTQGDDFHIDFHTQFVQSSDHFAFRSDGINDFRVPGLPASSSTTDSMLVIDNNGQVKKRAQSTTRKSTTVTASTYTVPADVDVVFVNCAGTATISLPSGTHDREITIKNLNTSNTVALFGLDPSESNTIATRGAITVKFTGSTWVGISKY